MLALQRTAGNAAVAARLGSRPGAVIARRNLPEDADTLEDVAAVAKAITIDTTAMIDRVGGELGDRLARQRARGHLRAGSNGPAKLDVVSFADLDFTPYGGLETATGSRA